MKADQDDITQGIHGLLRFGNDPVVVIRREPAFGGPDGAIRITWRDLQPPGWATGHDTEAHYCYADHHARAYGPDASLARGLKALGDLILTHRTTR